MTLLFHLKIAARLYNNAKESVVTGRNMSHAVARQFVKIVIMLSFWSSKTCIVPASAMVCVPLWPVDCGRGVLVCKCGEWSGLLVCTQGSVAAARQVTWVYSGLQVYGCYGRVKSVAQFPSWWNRSIYVHVACFDEEHFC